MTLPYSEWEQREPESRTHMNLGRLAMVAKQQIDKRGGTEALKRDAEQLRNIANGPGSAGDKAKRAADALKRPGPPGNEPRAGNDPRAPRH